MEKSIANKKGLIELQPASRPSRGRSERALTRVTLSGVVAVRTEKRGWAAGFQYVLLGNSGHEYLIAADHEWRQVLSKYCWEEVRVVGLLNISQMTLIPQKVYPKGPTGENTVESAFLKSKEFAWNAVKKVNDLLVNPSECRAFVCA